MCDKNAKPKLAAPVPSFLGGMGAVISAGAGFQFVLSDSPEASDAAAIMSDWEAVGDQLRLQMRKCSLTDLKQSQV